MARGAVRSRIVRPYWHARLHSLGDNTLIHKAHMMGAHKIAIGSDGFVFGAFLSVQPRLWQREEPAIVVGDRVGLTQCRVVAGESIVLEDDVAVGHFSLVTDSDHLLDGPHDQLGRNPITTAPVRIGRGTGVGERVAVLAGSNIGRYCAIGSNSVVRGNIPDYSLVMGTPARVVGRTREPRETDRLD